MKIDILCQMDYAYVFSQGTKFSYKRKIVSNTSCWLFFFLIYYMYVNKKQYFIHIKNANWTKTIDKKWGIDIIREEFGKNNKRKDW